MSPRQNEPDSKNLLLAIGLSLVVLLGFQFLWAGPQEAARKAAAAEQAKAAPAAPAAGQPGATAAGTAAPAAAGTPASAAPAIAAVRVPVEGPALAGSINTAGARIDQMSLTRYRETVQPDSGAVRFLYPQTQADGFYAFFGWKLPEGTTGQELPGPNTVWRVVSGTKLTPATPVVLGWSNGTGLAFTRTISIDDNYLITVSDQVTNSGTVVAAIVPYGAIRRHTKTNEPPDPVNHQGALGQFGPETFEKFSYRQMENLEAPERFSSTGGWIGFTDRYWLAALIPDQADTMNSQIEDRKNATEEVFEASYGGGTVQLAPGTSLTKVQHLYVGSKQVDTLRRYGTELDLPRFDNAVDWGILALLTRPFYSLLAWLNGLIGDIGLAILTLTVLVKTVTFPLVYTSYKSFARLRDLAPKMQELKERFAADPQRQQKEMIQLYQSEKINPVAGCVPILLQMPIFFALYKVLSISLELRHQPFFGWIDDLSSRDPTTVFNLFGLLPFDPSAIPFIGPMLMIGAWPILYGVSYWLLMKMQPPATDQLQRQIFAMMPWIFVIVFAGFGAGLVIYYTWSNLLTIVQQYVIARRTGSSNPIDEFFARVFKKKTAAGS